VKIKKVRIENFRSIRKIEEIEFSNITVFIGKNDSGKSNILLALDKFFSEKFTEGDLNKHTSEECVIEVIFEIDKNKKIYLDATNIETTLSKENLLNKDGDLDIILRIGRQKQPRPCYFLKTYDYSGDFSNLAQKNEEELNKLLEEYKISFGKEKFSFKSGRGKENRKRREILRNYAEKTNVQKKEQEIKLDEGQKDKLLPQIKKIINEVSFTLYPGNTPLSIAETEHQSKLRPLLELAINQSIRNRKDVEEKIKNEFQKEIQEIQKLFQKDTGMDLEFLFEIQKIQWDKLITPTILTKEDEFSIELEKRGLGTQRLFLMAMFRYLSERIPKIKNNNKSHFVFAIEEPESFLHNDLQRKFFYSMLEISQKGPQIILTTHSPIFARENKFSKVYLTTYKKENGTCVKNVNLSKDKYSLIKHELGIWNNDIFFNNAFLFIEGDTEEKCLPYIFQKLQCSYHELGIRLINVKGKDNVDKEKMKELFRFANDHDIKVAMILDYSQEKQKTLDDLYREYPRLFPDNYKTKILRLLPKNFVDLFPRSVIKDALSRYFDGDEDFLDNMLPEIEKCSNIENFLRKKCHENNKGDFNKPYFGECIGKALLQYEDSLVKEEPIKSIKDIIDYFKENL
jgi:putative ATP-dependent endonuclease of the OLD family